jgi:hypothetical protein
MKKFYLSISLLIAFIILSVKAKTIKEPFDLSID